MKLYKREKTETVTANAAKLAVLLALFKDKLIQDPERALRVAGAPLFAAFRSFSNAEIEDAIAEAEKAGSDTVALEAFEGEAPVAAAPKPPTAPDVTAEPTTAPSEEAPSPETVPSEPTTDPTN
jgi:hypothetical protein